MRRTELLGLRVDQVGSLLRPASLIESFLSCAKGEITRSALDALVEQAVRDVVAKQQAIGFPVVTDGEYGRINWHVSFSQIEGWALDEASWRSFLANPAMRHEHERANTLGADAVQSYQTPATARLRLLSNFPLSEYRRLAALATTPAKAMLMGPDRVSQMCDLPASKPVYESADAFLADVVAVQSRMVGELVEAGCPYVQLDEPSYTGYVDRATLERMRASGEDPMANLRRAIAASNAVMPATPARRCSASTSAAATAPACGIAKAPTTASPRSCSRPCASTASCWSTTPPAPAASSRCASCPRAARPGAGRRAGPGHDQDRRGRDGGRACCAASRRRAASSTSASSR